MPERFYCPEPGFREGVLVTLDGDEFRHLARARRVGEGEVVELFDGFGGSSLAEVVELGRNRVTLRPGPVLVTDRIPPIALTLASAVPKGDRIDWLVEKATELGVSRFVPILTERSVVDPRASKLERLRRTIVEASKQCGRNRLMEIGPPTSWPDLLRSPARPSCSLIAHPDGLPFGAWPAIRAGNQALVAVGPEGGFTGREVEEARQAGFTVVALGPTLLRIETAALTACARAFALAE